MKLLYPQPLSYKFQKKILEGNLEMKKSGFEEIDAK